MNFIERAEAAKRALAAIAPATLRGRVSSVSGLSVEIAGLSHHLVVGDRLSLDARGGRIAAEIIGFRGATARAMTFGSADGIGPGTVAHAPVGVGGVNNTAALYVSDAWVGRVVDPLGQPLDGLGALPRGPARAVRASPPSATLRARLGERLDLGVRVLNLFTTCREGQRLGLFAGAGVGKSTLLAMLARYTAADIVVLALVGERGREVREFLEDELGVEARARAICVVATSDAPPLLRREAAYAAMTIAEHFRDAGKSVLLLMDSITRFCLALREIGLSAGEPSAIRGFPPSVFAELPRLLERAGPGAPGGGQITALISVLVEGDDQAEPIADAVRGILDGHVVLDRAIAEAGRYPAVNVMRSLSRSVPGCNSAEENALTQRARAILALAAEMTDLVRLGAYQAGTDPAVDAALEMAPRLERLLRQDRDERADLASAFDQLRETLDAA